MARKVKEDVIMIYKLYHETRLTSDDIIRLFPDFTKKDIEKIGSNQTHNQYTKDIIIDTVYKHKIITSRDIYPLGKTYVQAIFIMSTLRLYSIYMITDIFKISTGTVVRIRDNKCYNDITSIIDIEHYKDKFKDITKKTKRTILLSNDQKKELVQKLELVRSQKCTIRYIIKYFNTSKSAIQRLMKKEGINSGTKYNCNKLDNRTILRIFDLANNEDANIRSIADNFDVNYKTVNNIRDGITHRVLLEKRRKEQLISKEMQKYL